MAYNWLLHTSLIKSLFSHYRNEVPFAVTYSSYKWSKYDSVTPKTWTVIDVVLLFYGEWIYEVGSYRSMWWLTSDSLVIFVVDNVCDLTIFILVLGVTPASKGIPFPCFCIIVLWFYIIYIIGCRWCYIVSLDKSVWLFIEISLSRTVVPI